MLTIWIYSLRVHVSITVLCVPLSQCFGGDICVLNPIPMHFNSTFSCVRVGSKWSNQTAVSAANQNRRFSSDSRFDNSCGMHVIGQTGPAWPADSCVAGRERSEHYSFLILILSWPWFVTCAFTCEFCGFLGGFRHSCVHSYMLYCRLPLRHCISAIRMWNWSV